MWRKGGGQRADAMEDRAHRDYCAIERQSREKRHCRRMHNNCAFIARLP
jgi:hypothetical protein